MNNSTLLQPSAADTEKIDITDCCSNADFLQAVIGIFGVDALPPLVVSFAGDPTAAKSSVWHAKPCLPEMELPAGCKNCFARATFLPDQHGKFSLRKKSFSARCRVLIGEDYFLAGLDHTASAPGEVR